MRPDPLLVVCGAAVVGTAACTDPPATIVACTAAAAILLGRVSWWVLVLGLCVAGGSALRSSAAVEAYEQHRVAARDAIGAPAVCAGAGRVDASPRVVGGTVTYLATLGDLDCEGRPLPGPSRARLWGGPSVLRRGDEIEVVAKLAPVRLLRNVGLADPRPRAARQGVVVSGSVLAVSILSEGRGLAAWIDRARRRARERIVATFAPAAAPMARALVLGENDLDPADDVAFRNSGLAHLLAVSGTHLVFAVVAIVRAVTAVLVRIETIAARFDASRLAAAFGAILALVYADYAGGSGSAWRAAWMLSAAFVTRAAGRRPLPARVLAASMGVGALTDPFCASDISFLLSAAATSGLIVLGQPMARRCRRIPGKPLRVLAMSVAATCASMLPCAPLLAVLSSELTAAGIAANVVAAPVGELVALPLCLVHSLLGFWPALERGTAVVASGALLVVKRVAHTSAAAAWLRFPVGAPTPFHFVVLGAGVLGALVAQARLLRVVWMIATAAALGVVELAAAAAGRPVGNLRVSALDVGQGDCSFVDLPDGTLMVVDGGGFVGGHVDPGARVVLPMLRARRRRRIDVAVLSHAHPDHLIGLATALRSVEVGELWDSGQGAAEGAPPEYTAMLRGAREAGVPVLGPEDLCGSPRRYGRAEVELIAPCPRFRRGLGPNDSSLVIRISFGERAALLMGDAEQAEEEALVARSEAKLRADLLKVGHHGSATSTSGRLLEAVRPRFATISCGVRNRFAHPSPATIGKLWRAGALPLRLDRVGSVTWRTDGHGEAMRLFSRPR